MSINCDHLECRNVFECVKITVKITHVEDGYMIDRTGRELTELCAPGTYDRVGYVLGEYQPNFPVPAIVMKAQWQAGSGTVDAIFIFELTELCPVCQTHFITNLVASWDFNSERCFAYGFDLGVYLSTSTILEGIEFYDTVTALRLNYLEVAIPS